MEEEGVWLRREFKIKGKYGISHCKKVKVLELG